MNVGRTTACRRDACSNAIPRALATEQLCLNHFLDEAFLRTDQAVQGCQGGSAVDAKTLEWLLSDALLIVNNLEEGAERPDPQQRDRMLELLLILANLHEYVAHHSVRTRPLS
ncbi:MAG TPA: hypothetical protein VMA31_02450 [Bryobacteraceae bacterium]|jgi:hypothetical protein|nr:hypothetical protein [Bryobacteraceae bacterium]